MSEEMQPIDPVTAAMLMGKTPDPCEPISEISHKVLTRLMDVVEFGDQLERVEKDRLLAHLKDVLAEKQPDLWVVHSVGPNELHPMISKKAADQHATELADIYKETSEKFGLRFDVIPSPFSPQEHFEILAEETIQHRDNLLEYVKELKKPAKTQAIEATDATLDKLRAGGLSIDGDNAYKRDLLDCVVGVLAFGKQNIMPPPAGHWLQRFWDIGHAEGERQGTTLVMPAGLHPDTQDLVTRFATALAVKLHAAELKHGYSDGWKEPHWMDECRQKLLEHLAKGDPRDVTAYCAFLWHHCQSTSAPSTPCTWERDEDTGAYETGCGVTWHFTDGGDPEENSALYCHHCSGSIVIKRRQIFAYQVGDNDIVAAYDPVGAIKVLSQFNGYPDDEYEDSDVELVSDKVLDNTEAFDIDEGKTITLEKTLRQELAELTEPAYLHGWE